MTVTALAEPVDTSSKESVIVTRDGIRLSVREYGNPHAPNTVVLIHGFCLTKDSWNIQAEELADHWGDDIRVLSYDHRGHGQSQATDMGTYSIDQLALDLADVLSVMNVGGNVTLAGHSMGGMTMLAYMALPASQRPVEPKSLLLVATAAGKLSSRGIGVLLASPAATALYKAVDHVPDKFLDPIIRHISAPLIRTLIGHVAYMDNGFSAAATSAAWSINDTPLRTKAGFIHALKLFDKYSALNTITAETLILSGGKDCLTPREHADDMNSAITGSKHMHFRNAGHMIMHEVPEAVTSALDMFISLSTRNAITA